MLGECFGGPQPRFCRDENMASTAAEFGTSLADAPIRFHPSLISKMLMSIIPVSILIKSEVGACLLDAILN